MNPFIVQLIIFAFLSAQKAVAKKLVATIANSSTTCPSITVTGVNATCIVANKTAHPPPSLNCSFHNESLQKNRMDQIINAGVLRLGSDANGGYKPFIYQLNNGTFAGIDIDLAHSLAQALGVKLQIVQSSWKTLMQDYEDNKFDIAMGGISITLERQLKAYFSNGYLNDGKAPIANCTAKDKYQTVQQMNKPGVRVDVFPGGTNEAWARANIKPQNIVLETPSGGNLLEKGKADVMVTDVIETLLMQHEYPFLCAINPDKPLTFAQFGILLPQDITLKLFVDQWLNIGVNSGFVKERVNYWTNYDWPK